MMSREEVHVDFTESDVVDRISRLPDDLIGNILSRLPTIEAVKTCVLSKNWEHKWTSISRIQINCQEGWASEEKLPDFVNFMQKIFRYVRNVKTIYIRSEYSSSSRFDHPGVFRSFVSGFLIYKAEIFDIDFFHFHTKADVFIHGRLLSRETLRELRLGYVFLKLPNEIYFPHLKKFHLESVEISSETANTTLKFTLPVLQTLDIVDCTWPNVKLVEIDVPSLHTLVSQSNSEKIGDYEIKIVGATGPVLFDSDGVLDNILFVGSNIVSASIMSSYEYSDEYGDDSEFSPSERLVGNIRNLLKESLPTLVDLKLSPSVAQLFVKVLLESKRGFSPPIFDKLERLFLCVVPDDAVGRIEPLIELLHAAPFLKCLAIDTQHIEGWDGYDYDYDAMESIPSCLMSTIEEIELCISCNSIGELDEYLLTSQFNLAKFLMQIGAKAELKRFDCKMWVVDSDYCNSDEFMEQISSFPRAPPHFNLCVSTVLGGNIHIIKRFSYCESCWVEDV